MEDQGKIVAVQKLLVKGEIMDSKLNRCAYGAWHYGEKLCEVCTLEVKGQPVKFIAQILLATLLGAGFVASTPAAAEAPQLTQKQKIKLLEPKQYALAMVKKQWKPDAQKQFSCLNQLWTKESNWRSNALNKSSGAFGIAQFLPTTWANYKYPYKPKDPQIQIDAGLRYIYKRYSSPCHAWAFWQKKAGPDLIGGWY